MSVCGAESALRLVSDELSYILATPLTAGDMARARGVLAKARLALEHAEPPADMEQENAQLRARCQAAESALRLVLASYDFHATEDEDLCHQLREPMDAARQVLEHAKPPEEGTP